MLNLAIIFGAIFLGYFIGYLVMNKLEGIFKIKKGTNGHEICDILIKFLSVIIVMLITSMLSALLGFQLYL